MTAGLTPEDPELMLYADEIDRVHVQAVRRTSIRREVALGELETNPVGVRVTSSGVVHREHEAIEIEELRGKGLAQMGREGGDPALAGQVIAEHRDPADRSRVAHRHPAPFKRTRC